ncbi:MAG: M14 family metallopeptidase [Candidatus Paceibacterota bacterium]
MKKNTVLLAIAVIVGVGILYYFANLPQNKTELPANLPAETVTPAQNDNAPKVEDQIKNKTPEEPQAVEPINKSETIIGKSIMNREIIAYNFGTGTKEILFVGGIHGGYSWNTSLLAYQMIDYLKASPNAVPVNVKVTVIPVLNPDGLSKVVSVTGRFSAADVSSSPDARISGRFNGTSVDLNRNFDCGWKAQGIWQNKPVSGGKAAFSEPESAAIRDYAQNHKLTAVIAWYSTAGGVYSSSCGNGILPETQAITDIYAKASGYPAHKNFESYQVSGDMTDWFAKNNVPAIGVILAAANDPEWGKNLDGIKAIFDHYSK